MQEELIQFETAKLAKEKGFDVQYPNGRYFNGRLITGENIMGIAAPTQSLLQKWLRDEHKIDIGVNIDINNLYEVSVLYKDDCNYYGDMQMDDQGFKTYEEGLELGLQEALKLIK